jgi:Carboxypeptidase regulatory-like domain
MKRISMCFAVALVLCAVSSPALWAQATAQISGAVRDQSGAVLPGAEVTATQTETAVARSTISNETGSYVLPNLQLGPYKLEVALPGFRTFVQTGIVLQVNSNPVINATLEVGQVSEQIEVQANAALVETQRTSVGGIVETERVLELPLNGRNSAALIEVAGAVVPQGASSSRSMNGGLAFSVAGGQSFGVAYLLDGAMHNNPYDNLNLPLPFPDALQEFRVDTSAMKAEQGMHSGATVNSVTKSGTNDIHGDVFEFVRNYIFNAKDPFQTKRDSLKRNQFGGTVGGPIKKNKLFFFAAYQGTITRQDPNDSFSFVPTAAVLSGDWTAMASKACNSAGQRTLRTPFVNGGTNANGDTIYTINPSQYSPAAVRIAGKLPQTSDPCGRINVARINRPDEGQYIGKVDFQRTATHSMFGRYMATTYKALPPYNFSDNVLSTTVGGRDNLAQSYTFGDTRLFGPNTVNAIRLAVNRTAIHRTSKDFFSAPDVGINIFSYMPHYMLLTVNNFFSLGGGTESESTFRTTTYQLGEDISVVRGNHQISAGVNVAHWRSNSYANVRSPGVFSFDGSLTGLALGDFLTGRLVQLTDSLPNTLLMKQSYVGVYGQDTWKVTPKLTLNYGVRWEPFLPQTITNGAVFQFDLNRFVSGTKSTVFKNAPAGLYYPGDRGFPGKSGMYKIWNTFGPRVGLSWDPSGNGKTVVRASYGLSYDFVNGQFFINSTIAPPWGGDVRVNSPAGGLDDPWRDYPGGNPFPYVPDANAKFPAGAVYLTVPYHMNPNTIHNWNLTVQKQLASDWLVSASYLGSEATHLWVSRSLNPGTYFFNGTNSCVLPNGTTITGTNNQCSTTGNIEQRRPFVLQNPAEGQLYGAVDVFDDGGTQSYAGMLLQVQHRLSRGLTFNSSYTLSHCIGDNTQGGGTPNINTGILDPNNRRLDRANCAQDRRHLFSTSGVASMPKFANTTLNKIASGWRLSGIFTKRSGQFLTITTGTDVALTGIGSQRGNQLSGNSYAAKQLVPTGSSGFLSYLGKGCTFAQTDADCVFKVPAPGTLGSMGRNNILGSGFWNFDLALSRIFQLRERQRLEIRAEAFNVTNSFRPGNPQTALNNQNFGLINSSQGEPRIMQWAFKYVF